MDGLFEADVNYLAVVLGALAAQVLGFLWYGKLFHAPWIAARAIDPSEGENPGPIVYVVPMVCALVIAYTLARLCDMVAAEDVGECIAIGAFCWVGFAGTVQLMQINFSEAKVKRVPTFVIEGGYHLSNFVIMGAIIGAFQ